MLSLPVAETLINIFIFIFPCIDYCNALLAGVSKASLNKRVLVQNAAQILSGNRTRDHITPVHWLPVRFRVDKALHGLSDTSLSNWSSLEAGPINCGKLFNYSKTYVFGVVFT